MQLIKKAMIVTDGKIYENTDVLVDKGRIVKMGQDLPMADASIYDASGQTLLPGLIDCHVHIVSDGLANPMTKLGETIPLATLRAARNVKRSLNMGITTVRSLGGFEGVEVAVRKGQQEGIIQGAKVLAANRGLCMTGGHGHFIGREVDGPDEARKGTREQFKAGADVLKLFATGGVSTPGVEPGAAQLTYEEMFAAISEAHKAGRKATAHAQGTEGIKNAILAGIDSIEHGIFLDEEVIELMIQKGVYLVPTLVAPERINTHGEEGGIPTYAVEKSRRVTESHIRSFQMAKDLGVKIAFGTDAGTPFNFHGENARELLLMHQYGMAVLDVLRAATAGSADNLGLGHDRGRIEAGLAADLLLIDGNVLADLSLLTSHVVAVMQDGVWIKRDN